MTARLSRRHALGAGAALFLIAASEAGAAKARELDGELLGACAAFKEAEREVEAAEAIPFVSDAQWEALIDTPAAVWNDALHAVNACPAARTPEGLQAAAEVAFTALRRFHDAQDQEDLRSIHPTEIGLALAVLRDVAGRAGA